jgi:hypothetical protein
VSELVFQASRYWQVLTIQAGIVWLQIDLLNSTILGEYSIPLPTMPSKDGRAVEGQVPGVGKGKIWVSNEANLVSKH